MVAHNPATADKRTTLDNHGRITDRCSSLYERDYRLLRLQQRFATSRKGMRLCGAVPIEGHASLGYRKGFSGLYSCNSSLCVSCSKRLLMTERKPIIEAALTKCKEGTFYFFTLTQPSLCEAETQIDRLSKSYTNWKETINRRIRRNGLKAAFLRSYDITFRKHGNSIFPHLHIHGLIWISGDLDFDVSDYAFEVWERIGAKQAIACSRKGYYFSPVDRSKGSSSISAYVSKSFGSVAYEVMSSNTKVKVQPNKWNLPQLLDYINQTGDKTALAAYNNLILAFEGKRFVSIPKFFRSFKTEEEPVEMEGKDPEVPDILISKPVFKAFRTSNMDFRLLKVAMTGSRSEFNRLRNLIIDFNLAYMMGETTIAEMVVIMPALMAAAIAGDRLSPS